MPADTQQVAYQVDVRYFGQGFDIPVDVDPAWLQDPDGALRTLGERFDAEHERLFSFVLSVDHELVNARATVTGPRPKVAPTPLEPGTGDPSAARAGQARIYVDGGWQDAARYDRVLLKAGDVIPGPAIVTEMDSTTLILPGHVAAADPSGSLLIRPAGHGDTAKES